MRRFVLGCSWHHGEHKISTNYVAFAWRILVACAPAIVRFSRLAVIAVGADSTALLLSPWRTVSVACLSKAESSLLNEIATSLPMPLLSCSCTYGLCRTCSVPLVCARVGGQLAMQCFSKTAGRGTKHSVVR